MPVPSLFDLTLPVLRLACEKEINYSEAADRIAQELKLTPADAAEMLPSGRDRKLVNRIKWAKVELGMAELVESTKPSHFQATASGAQILKTNPGRIDRHFLMSISAYRTRIESIRERAAETARSPSPDNDGMVSQEAEITPQETIEQALLQIENGITQELLTRVMQASPRFFELLVIELLKKMGYGGARSDAGQHLGQSGDGGIDGLINQDPLGLDGVYIQAKRYGPNSASIGEPDIRNFVGSLVGRSATKGVFFTTGSFSASAKNYVRTVPHRIVLIDGAELTRLMVKHNVGVRTERAVDIKTIDTDFFDEG